MPCLRDILLDRKALGAIANDRANFQRQLACVDGLGQDFGVVYAPGIRLNVLTDEQWMELTMSRSGEMLAAMMADSTVAVL